MPRLFTALLCLLMVTSEGAAETVSGEDVTYHQGALTLAAELIVPHSDRPGAAVVIVQGSGRSDRTNRWSRDFADLFAGLGVAVLLTDKRGAGGSAGDWRSAGFDELAQDVLAGVSYLRSRREIDPSRIGLVGLSQGGQVVPIAAAASQDVAFVLTISSKAVGFAEGSFIEMGNTARQAGLGESAIGRVLSLNAAALRFVALGDWTSFERLREDMLVGPTADLAAGFPSSADAPIWQFIRKVAFHDPLSWWIQVAQPALIVYGEADERDNAPVVESVRRLRHAFASVGKRNARILVIPDVGHGRRGPGNHDLSAVLRDSLVDWLEDLSVLAHP